MNLRFILPLALLAACYDNLANEPSRVHDADADRRTVETVHAYGLGFRGAAVQP